MMNQSHPVFMFGEKAAYEAMVAAREVATMALSSKDLRQAKDSLELIMAILGYQHDCRSKPEREQAREWRKRNRPVDSDSQD